ncbi:hypothetical protein KY332_01100 [Candidatus Woesearchaeota archaeon]|nr:hypothetical protein [Candidatus Woesearchaeota archaeon]
MGIEQTLVIVKIVEKDDTEEEDKNENENPKEIDVILQEKGYDLKFTRFGDEEFDILIEKYEQNQKAKDKIKDLRKECNGNQAYILLCSGENAIQNVKNICYSNQENVIFCAENKKEVDDMTMILLGY